MAMKRICAIFSSLFLLFMADPDALAQDEHRALIIPVEFQDLKFIAPAETIDSLASELSLYFNEQFSGARKFIFDVAPAVSLGSNHSYYGANATYKRDALLGKMAAAVCKSISNAVDLSLYDNDSDGFVNDVILLTPGIAESSGGGEDQFWPQYLELDEKDIPNGQKVRLSAFAVASELDSTGAVTGIGIMAHEFGHILGLKDLYDTDAQSSGGMHPGLGHTCLMSYGLENDESRTPPNLNAIEREMLGIGNCEILDSSGVFTLEPISRNGRYFRLPSADPDKYYLIENREALGRDRFIGGEGMLIYRIDKSTTPAGWSTYYQRTISALERWQKNQINCNPQHPCAEIMPAEADSTDFSKVFWPQAGKTIFNPGTLAITGIRRAGGSDISFSLVEPVRIEGVSVFQSSAIIAWKVSTELGKIDSCKVEWSTQNSLPGRADGVGGEEGRYSFTLNGLNPRTTYNYRVFVYYEDGSTYDAGGIFTTRIYRSGIFPFIYIGDAIRGSDGSFRAGTAIPLVVYNCVDGHIDWFFNGRPVSAGGDGLWTIPGSGTLKAEITHPDGSKDIIIKEIQVQ